MITDHRQPARFPTPSILAMANASNPENAPAIDPAEKKIASLDCNSCLQYQQVRRYVAAGKKPACKHVN